MSDIFNGLVSAAAVALTLTACTGAPGARSAPPAGTTQDASEIVFEEATALYFDVAPDGALVIDALGQLWELPRGGGAARALTAAARDAADDRQPAISADGAWIATRSDRQEGRGIRVHARDGRSQRQVTDSAVILGADVGVPVWLPHGRELLFVRRGVITQVDIATRAAHALTFDSLANTALDEPALSTDGRRLLVTGPWPGGSARALLDAAAAGAPLWEIDLATARARRLTPANATARAPAFAPDGERIAYFTSDSFHVQLVVRDAGGSTRVVATDAAIEPRRVRWSTDGSELIYVAAGRLRRVPLTGGAGHDIPFVARMPLPRVPHVQTPLRVPQPGSRVAARGFSGLALSPDGAHIALLALGRLWLIDRSGGARAAADVPVTALGVSWAPDSRAVVWGDGVEGEQDMWVSDVASGNRRRITQLPGSEWPLGWSRSGAWIAFTYQDSIRIVRAGDAAGRDSLRNLGPVGFSETAAFGSPWAWLPGDTLLLYGMAQWPVSSRACVEAELIALDGGRRRVTQFPCRPAHPAIDAGGALLAIENGLLVRHARTADGWGPPTPVTSTAALYPSAAADGSLLFAASDGLHLRARDGADRALGWPVSFEVPRAAPLLLHNVRIVPLEDGDVVTRDVVARDVLIADGRIRAIGDTGSLALPAGAGRVIDAAGRWLLPGFIDTHLHFIDTDIAVPQRALEHGVTTLREMWNALGFATAFRDAIAAGVVSGARIVVSGPPIYPWPGGAAVTSDFLWVPTDSAEADRVLALLAGFGAGHVKMRYVQTWSGGVQFVRRAQHFGLRVSGHCAHSVALVLAGITGHEHSDGQCGDWEFGIRDDVAQLYAHAGVTVAPVIDLHEGFVRSSPDMPAAARTRLQQRTGRARDHALRLHRAGVPVVTGSDAQGQPGGVHREMAQLVRGGLPARAALRAATRDAATALGLGGELGLVQPGYVADLVLLDGDPLADIGNTRRIWLVVQGGRIAFGAGSP